MRLRYRVVNGKHIYDRGDYDYYKIYRPQKRQRTSGYKKISAYERYEKTYAQKTSIKHGSDIYQPKLSKEDFDILIERIKTSEKVSTSIAVNKLVQAQRRWNYKVQKRLEVEASSLGIDLYKLWKSGEQDIDSLGSKAREASFINWADNMIASEQVPIGTKLTKDGTVDTLEYARDLFEDTYY